MATRQRLLAQGADINFQGLGGYTALLISVEEWAHELVEFILAQNPDLTAVRKDDKGALELVKDESILALLESALSANEFNDDVSQSELSESTKKTIHRFFGTSEDILGTTNASLFLYNASVFVIAIVAGMWLTPFVFEILMNQLEQYSFIKRI